MDVFDQIQQQRMSSFFVKDEKAGWMALIVACCRFNKTISQVCINKIGQLCRINEVFTYSNYVHVFGECIVGHDIFGARALIDSGHLLVQKEDYPTVFAMCVDVAFSDGELHDEKRKIIQYLIEKLMLTEELAKMVVDVTLIKNRRDITFYIPK